MRKMKKMAALCMAGMMALSLAACSGGAKETTAVAPAETQAETAAQTTAEEKAQETKAEIEAAGGQADILQCNVADFDACEAFFR